MILTSFIAAVFFALITPGPGVLSTAGIGANFGLQAGLRFLLGLFAGNAAVFVLVACGMFSLLEAIPTFRLVLAVVSLLYLLYLATKIAFAGSKLAFINPDNPPGIWGGLMLQFINPKAYAVHSFFLSNFAVMPGSPIIEVSVKFLIINLLWIPIHFLWLGMGLHMHRLELAPSLQRRINVAMAFAMLLVIALAAFVAQAG